MRSLVPRVVEPTADPSTVAIPGLVHPIWLVRHASTSWTGQRWCGRADPPLSPAGRVQANDLAQAIASAPDFSAGAAIRTSPARRAHATARAVARVTGWPIAVDEDLLEVDVGLAEGLSWSEFEVRYADLAATLVSGDRIDWPGGETVQSVARRGRAAADRVIADSVGGAVVVVSHGALLHALARAIAPSATMPFFTPGGVVQLVPGPR